MNSTILGIDISKQTFDVALLINDNNKTKTKKFSNNPKGFSDLKLWLTNKSVHSVHACMEATGSYGTELALFLYNNNFKVSIVNPARIKGFSLSTLSRVKTDKADSSLIAHFCKAMQPELWHPTASHIQELQQWVHRLDTLIAIKNQETNRLENVNANVAINIQQHVDFLDKQIKEVRLLISSHINKHKDLKDKNLLLTSIPGIGDKTIAVILSFLSNVEDFDSSLLQ